MGSCVFVLRTQCAAAAYWNVKSLKVLHRRSRRAKKKQRKIDECDKSWMNEKRKKDHEIAMLKRMIKTLEMVLMDMQSTSRVPGQDKTGWTEEELNFVKDINDFCRDRLHPKEKFLRKNWQEYLPNDRRSCTLCL